MTVRTRQPLSGPMQQIMAGRFVITSTGQRQLEPNPQQHVQALINAGNIREVERLLNSGMINVDTARTAGSGRFPQLQVEDIFTTTLTERGR